MKAYNACPIRLIRLLRLLCPILILMVFTSSTVLPGAGLLPVVTTGSGPSTQLSNILFVVPSGAASGECASWGTGCDLQYALTKAAAPAKLWVKMGIYHPTTGTDQNASFQLKNGVAIYGGFLGTETALDQREPGVNRTTLSGEIGSATTFDNSYHVVIASGTDTSAVLDGVTINAGNATGAAPNSRAGGGMVIANGSPTLSNVTFSNNSASNNGGGLYCSVGSPELNSVTFIGNTAGSSGGGMFIISGSPVLKNVTFTGNTATDGGGALYNWQSNPVLKNVTFSGNSAPTGGAIYNDSDSNPNLINSILYGDMGGEIYNNSGTATVTYSIVEDGYTGTGNLNLDPKLGPLQNNGGFTQTMALGAGSPAINAGTNEGCPETDQRGVKRPQSGQCDIGAYEYRLDATFEDVPTDHWAWVYIEGLYNAGVTSGCSLSPLMFCPSTTVTRDQMAVFLLKAKYGSAHIPPTPIGVFLDVPTDYWAAPWIEELAAKGITSGCSVSPKLYCPTTTVTRDQMAVFLLKAEHGSGYTPPAPTGVFQDVPTNYWAAGWVERLATEGITGGCSATPQLYCPAIPVSRDQMAVFLDKTFGIPLLP